MTESEWLAYQDPTAMLAFLRGKVSDRKLRLLGTGICRQFQDQIETKAFSDAIETVEVYADTGKTKAALKRARQGVRAIRHGLPSGDKTRVVEWVALWLAEVAASENAFGGTADELIRLAGEGLVGPDLVTSMVTIMRCVIGRQSFRPNSKTASWRTSVSVSMAQTIYDDRAFNQLPLLAEALETAGCTDKDILEHCRDSGPHVRGCWVVDMLLGKE